MPADYSEYKCKGCGFVFNRANLSDELRCPRCGGQEVEASPFLFGSKKADELTVEDYIATCMQPCCGNAENLRFSPLWRPEEQKEKE